jgi:hypothetical protein
VVAGGRGGCRDGKGAIYKPLTCRCSVYRTLLRYVRTIIWMDGWTDRCRCRCRCMHVVTEPSGFRVSTCPCVTAFRASRSHSPTRYMDIEAYIYSLGHVNSHQTMQPIIAAAGASDYRLIVHSIREARGFNPRSIYGSHTVISSPATLLWHHSNGSITPSRMKKKMRLCLILRTTRVLQSLLGKP